MSRWYGLVTNDVKKLEDGEEMRAAFPNAKGRLLAVTGILRRGDRFLFETGEATAGKIFENLYRFTYAGDFFVVLDVRLPPADTDDARALYEKMANEMAFDPRAGL